MNDTNANRDMLDYFERLEAKVDIILKNTKYKKRCSHISIYGQSMWENIGKDGGGGQYCVGCGYANGIEVEKSNGSD